MSSKVNGHAKRISEGNNVKGTGYTGDERAKKSRKDGKVTQLLARTERCPQPRAEGTQGRWGISRARN